MNKKPIETIMGAIVLFIAASFVFFAYNSSNLHVAKGYEITGHFLKAGGINIGSDIKINGVKVGTVSGQKLDTETYLAVIKMNIYNDIKLPKDSVFQIAADGLMGENFIKVTPGQGKDIYKNGETIIKTADFKTIEDLVGEVIFAVTGD